MRTQGGYHLLLDNGGSIQFAEPRFLDDDLKKLAAANLLSPDFASDGRPIYRIARSAVKYIEAIDGRKDKAG